MKKPSKFCAWVLESMPGSAAQIAKRSGVCLMTVNRWVKILCADNLAYVSAVTPPKAGGWPTEFYCAGPGVSVIFKKKNMTDQQMYRRYVAKARKDGRMALRLLKSRNSRLMKRTVAAGDPLINALFGRSA